MQCRLKGTTFDFFREMNGAPAKNCSVPEKRDASILLSKHIANAMIFRPFSIGGCLGERGGAAAVLQIRYLGCLAARLRLQELDK